MRIGILFFLFAMMPVACSAKLIGHWPFDGDISNLLEGSGLVAEDYGHVTFSDGLSRQALNLAGSEDSALIVSHSDALNDLKVFSVSCWVKLERKQSNALSSIVSKNGEQSQGWQIRMYKDYGFASFILRGKNGQTVDCFGGVRIDDGYWHHITAVFDGQFASIYVDGRLADIADAPKKGIGSTDSPLVIGAKIARDKKNPYCFFKGLIDDLMLFDHALSQDQIKKLSDRDRLLRDKLTEMYNDHNVYSIPIHRGAGKHQPENTLESFEYSWSRKLVPEGDIRTTKDDVIICFHDNDVRRTAPSAPAEFKEKKTGELTLKEIKSLDVGEYKGKPGQRIPTLAEVFEVMSQDPGKFIYLDYKTIDIKRLADMVRKYGIEKQVIFTTKNYDLIRKWRKLLPESQTMIWINGSQEVISRKIDYLQRNDFKDIYIIHLHYKPCGNSYQLTDEFMLAMQAKLKKQGIVLQIMPWNMKNGAVYERLFKIGIESVGTDYPDVLLPIYEKYFEKPSKAFR